MVIGQHTPLRTQAQVSQRVQLDKMARDLALEIEQVKQSEQALRDLLVEAKERHATLLKQRLKFLVGSRNLFTPNEMAELFGISGDVVRRQQREEMARLGIGALPQIKK